MIRLLRAPTSRTRRAEFRELPWSPTRVPVHQHPAMYRFAGANQWLNCTSAPRQIAIPNLPEIMTFQPTGAGDGLPYGRRIRDPRSPPRQGRWRWRAPRRTSPPSAAAAPALSACVAPPCLPPTFRTRAPDRSAPRRSARRPRERARRHGDIRPPSRATPQILTSPNDTPIWAHRIAEAVPPPPPPPRARRRWRWLPPGRPSPPLGSPARGLRRPMDRSRRHRRWKRYRTRRAMPAPMSHDPVAAAISNSAELCAAARDSIGLTWAIIANSRATIDRSKEAIRRADILLSKRAENAEPN
jgi:hypothetical protein